MIQLNGIPPTCWVRQKVYTAMCFIVMRHECVTKLWQIKIFLASSGKREVMLGARQDRSSPQSGAKTPAKPKQGGTDGWRDGGRKWEGEKEDMTGLHSSTDTPYNDMEWERRKAFTLPIKRSFHHQTVYSLQNHSQITHSCCSTSMLRMQFLVIFSCVCSNICLVIPII